MTARFVRASSLRMAGADRLGPYECDQVWSPSAASLASSRTNSLEASGDGHLAALTGGYHVAFLVGALFAAAAAALGAALLRAGRQQPAGDEASVGGVAAADACC